MGNLNRRIMRLESQAGAEVALIVVKPGETEEQAQERHFAQYPEHRSARKQFLVCIRTFTERQCE